MVVKSLLGYLKVKIIHISTVPEVSSLLLDKLIELKEVTDYGNVRILVRGSDLALDPV